MKPLEDSWNNESFDDEISRAMIALYETRLDPKCAQGSSPHRIYAEDLLAMRNMGVFVPAPDRVTLFSDDRNEVGAYQFLRLPRYGCISAGKAIADDPSMPDQLTSYCRLWYFKQLKRLPASMKMIRPGVPYEFIDAFPQDDGEVTAIRDYATVNQRAGQVTPCLNLRQTGGRVQNAMQERMADTDIKTDWGLAAALQMVEDSEHQWRITAFDNQTKVTVGAYAENVKSLLYAREVPLTPSGRRRPILHLVNAHRRRIKHGTDIDIKDFLRGTREVEMDGVKFKVQAPEKLIRDYLLKDSP